jgi:hypothetical protein
MLVGLNKSVNSYNLFSIYILIILKICKNLFLKDLIQMNFHERIKQFFGILYWILINLILMIKKNNVINKNIKCCYKWIQKKWEKFFFIWWLINEKNYLWKIII